MISIDVFKKLFKPELTCSFRNRRDRNLENTRQCPNPQFVIRLFPECIKAFSSPSLRENTLSIREKWEKENI